LSWQLGIVHTNSWSPPLSRCPAMCPTIKPMDKPTTGPNLGLHPPNLGISVKTATT
jgi:hypothetical protein